MSVFRLQEWWQTQQSQSEEFDNGCCVIGNIDNVEPASDKIVGFTNKHSFYDDGLIYVILSRMLRLGCWLTRWGFAYL